MSDRPGTLRDVIADPEQFREWYDASLPSVYRYLLSRCGHDVELAEELTQQTYERAIRHAAGFEGRSDPITWLCAIGRNRLVDHYRSATRRRRHAESDRAEPVRPGSEWHASETRDAVEQALSLLAPDQRLVLIFRYLDDLPVRDVARVMSRSESATESLLSRARDAFRRAYGDN